LQNIINMDLKVSRSENLFKRPQVEKAFSD